jgi:hypothetical protein
MAFLPPVVIAVEWDDESALAGMATYKDAMRDMAADTDASTAAMSKGAKGAGDDLKDLGDDAAASGALTRKSMEDARDGVDDSADDIHDSAGRIRSDLENVGEGAIAGGAATREGMEAGRDAVEDAEKDVESKTGGFSSRVAKVFESVGTSMGNWGIPFGESVSKVGEKIDEADGKGDGFKQSILSIGKAATMVGGVALAGFAAESVEMADKFDVSEGQVEQAVKNTGASFDAFKPKIESTYSRMEQLGFTNEQSAEAMRTLTTATQSPTKAMSDMGLAANIARLKQISLSAASQLLAKVYAGSNRALTQMGINLDVGSAKLTSIKTASEGVSKAQTALKTVQDEVNAGTLTGAAASDKLKAAHETLSAAEEKLKLDQNAVGTVMDALAKRTHGMAQVYGTTLKGQLDIAGAAIEHVGIAFGNFLMPKLLVVVKGATSVITWFLKGSLAAKILGAAITGPLVAAMAAYIGITTVAFVKTAAGWVASAAEAVSSAAVQIASWIAVGAAATAAFIAENVATLGIAAGIALLVTGITYLATHWTESWDTIKTVINGAVEFIKSHLAVVMIALAALLGPIGLVIDAALLLATHWKEVMSTITSLTTGIVNFIGGAVEKIIAFFAGLPKRILGFFEGLPGKIVNVMEVLPGDLIALGEKILEYFAKLPGRIVAFFVGLPGKVMNAVEALPGDMLTLGEKIMQAIIHGVEKLASAFVGALKKTILGPVESIVGAVEGIFGGGGGSKGGAAASGGAVEKQILDFWLSKGFSKNAAAGFVGNATAESSLTPGEAGGGLYQQSGDGASGKGSVAEQSQQVLERLSPSLKAALDNAKSPSEAANLIMKNFEKPAGSQPGETATTDQQARREQAATEAVRHIKGAIENTTPTAATGALKNTIATTSPTAVQTAISGTKATTAAETVKKAIETAKLKLDELKKVFTTGFSELAKVSEKLFKYTLAKGGVKSGELKGLEESHETQENAVAVRKAQETLKTAEGSNNPAEVVAAQEALNNALYTQKVAALKKESAAEEAEIAKQNAAKESAFTKALAQLKQHLENGKTTTKQGMKEIEKVLKEYGVTFGSVGKDAGTAWVKQFEAAIKKAATDAGGITAEITADIKAGLKIPGLAAGGIVTSPTLAVIGEAGPEAVIPLSGLSTSQPAALPMASATAKPTTAGLNVENVNVYGTSLSSNELLTELYLKLRPMLQVA